jgi:hypothetical protein
MSLQRTADSSQLDVPASRAVARRTGRSTYVPAISPRLRKLFAVLLVLLALLGANSGYLVSITALEAITGKVYQNYFYQLMFLGHLVLGLLLLGPFAVFAFIHTRNTLKRKNRRAVRAGYALLIASSVVLLSGILLMRVAGLDLKQPIARSVVYWPHGFTGCTGWRDRPFAGELVWPMAELSERRLQPWCSCIRTIPVSGTSSDRRRESNTFSLRSRGPRPASSSPPRR